MNKGIIIDKLNKGNRLEQGVLYCFNYHLKGLGLCDQCRTKLECQKEQDILKNTIKELKKLSDEENKIYMKSIEDYSLKDIERMCKV